MEKQKSALGIKTILKEYNKDIKRHIGVLNENFNGKIKIIAEQYGDIKNTLGSHTIILDSHTDMIASMKEDIEIIKTDIEFIKSGLKKKVDYEEFSALEKRLVLLESKMRR